jgi:hypothetical protein
MKSVTKESQKDTSIQVYFSPDGGRPDAINKVLGSDDSVIELQMHTGVSHVGCVGKKKISAP